MSPIISPSTIAHDCPDCLSDTNIVHLGNNIHVVQISHDPTCPTLAAIESRSTVNQTGARTNERGA